MAPAAPVPGNRTFFPDARVWVAATLEELSHYEYEPFPALAVQAVLGRGGVVLEHVLYGLLGLVVVELDGMDSLVWGFMPQYLAQAYPAGGGDEREAMTSSIPTACRWRQRSHTSLTATRRVPKWIARGRASPLAVSRSTDMPMLIDSLHNCA
jgi:hypothetical protein